MPGHSTLLAITVFTPALSGCLLLLSWLQHRRVTALALWGWGFITASVATTLIIVLRGTIPDFWSIIVGNALLAAAYGILWCGARKFDGKNVSMLLALMGVVFWLVASSIGPIYSQPKARATVMAAIGVAYTLLIVFELWRGRGDQVWRWPIMVLLLAHATAVPIHIPVAGALTHPDLSDPSDLDLLTFAIFEGAFVCICAAYLFGGLAKDRIAARYRHASLNDPLTGVANRRGFFETGERVPVSPSASIRRSGSEPPAISWSPLLAYCWCRAPARDPTIQHWDLCTPKVRMCRIGRRGDRRVRVVDTLVCRLRRLSICHPRPTNPPFAARPLLKIILRYSHHSLVLRRPSIIHIYPWAGRLPGGRFLQQKSIPQLAFPHLQNGFCAEQRGGLRR